MAELRRKALVVGISDYPTAPLQGCVNDATAVAEVLKSPNYGFSVEMLLDAAVTRSALRRALSVTLDGADNAVFYFAGHGIQTDVATVLLTHDAKEDDDDGLELDYLRKLVDTRGRNCKLILLVFDCCHSGEALPRGRNARVPATARDIGAALPLYGEGRVLLAACRSDQSAYETDDGTHGEFTQHLLQGLRGEASGSDGSITVHTLYEYLSARFEGNAKQTPMFRGDTTGRVILAEGFSPGNSKSPPIEIYRIIKEARQHLDEYHAKTSGTLEQWKSGGYRLASDLLSPIMHWLNRKEAQYPALKGDSRFAEVREAALTRLQQLAGLERGTETRYGKVEQYLGGGTFGSVYKLSGPTGRASVIKVYHPHDLRQEEKIKRFRRGYDAMRQLNHPHIVRVGEYSECPVAFLMDFIDGPNLRKFHVGSVEPLQLVRALLIIAETLQHAHGRDVIHRDVKPENIIMKYTEDGTWLPYLTDFDLAWFSTATLVTKDAVGTVFYAAPEQLAKPSSQVAHAETTDIYSFGQLIYYTLTGSDPVPLGHADNRRALAERLDQRYTPISAEALLDLYTDCTQYDPRDRVKGFRRICDRLYGTYSNLSDRLIDLIVPIGDFINEVRFALVGLNEDRHDLSSFTSLSTRTRVTLTARELADGTFRVDAHFAPQGSMAMQGLTNEAMRTTINSRVDAALSGFERVRRRSGKQGAFEMFVDIVGVEPSTAGVEVCREVVTRVIDAIER